MQAVALDIPGCFLLKGQRFNDQRGDFFKLFHSASFAQFGLENDFKESYITTSHKGVVRGMHFQSPPADHAKLVSCITGRVRDGLIDLREGLPSYGRTISFILSSESADALYVPRGVAHGFAAHEDDSRMWYLVGSVHDPVADAGIHWNSVGIDWWEGGPAIAAPIVSDRDEKFPPFSDFSSDFRAAP